MPQSRTKEGKREVEEIEESLRQMKISDGVVRTICRSSQFGESR